MRVCVNKTQKTQNEPLCVCSGGLGVCGNAGNAFVFLCSIHPEASSSSRDDFFTRLLRVMRETSAAS